MTTGHAIKAVKIRFCLTSRRGSGMGGAVVTKGFRAFTLIELLIVVAIIAILAAIAVPNFIEAQTRAKVARVTADMRSMLTAIETYRVDYNKPPIRNSDWQSDPPDPDYIPEADTKILDPAVASAATGLHTITTPISYMSSIPQDVFNTHIRSKFESYPGTTDGLDYWDDWQLQAARKALNPLKARGIARKGIALLSVGPDQYVGLNSSASHPSYPAEPTALRGTMRYFYDPTNGTNSYGNLYRFGDGLEQGDLYPIR